MDSPGSPKSSKSKSSINRLSSLYRFHNAPEVVTVQNSEYEDTICSSSNRASASVAQALERFRRSSSNEKDSFNRPPRIIFGMSVRTFLIVAVIVFLVLTGAVVGGAVGSSMIAKADNFADGTPSPTGGSPTSAPASISSSGSSSTRSASTQSATPSSAPSSSPSPSAPSGPSSKFTPSSACASQNDTTYTSQYASGSMGKPPSSSGLMFTTYCNFASPLSFSEATYISESYQYSLDDCIEACAGFNFYNRGWNCTAAVYQASSPKPGNCWIGFIWNVTIENLEMEKGTDVALLLGASGV